MTPLRKNLQTIENGLEALLQRTREMKEMLDAIESVLTTERPKKKVEARAKSTKRKSVGKTAKKKSAKVTATQAVINVISKSKEGATSSQIKKETGLNERQIWGIINRMKKQGKIRSEKRGLYVNPNVA